MASVNDFSHADIDTSIYGMPQFVNLEVSDLARSRAFYTGALGYVELAAIPGPGGSDALVHLRRWRHQDILLVPAREPVRAGRGVVVGVAAREEQLAGIAERAEAAGVYVDGPADTAWNTVDVQVTDPDGYRITFTAMRPADRRDGRFDAMMAELPVRE